MSRVSLLKRILVLFPLLVFSFFVFFRLGYYSLDAYDEAWYGSISRNILSTHNPLLLTMNGSVFTDHPPASFWFMAISQAVFGSSEFSVRLFSALCSIGALVFVYKIGKKVHSWQAGYISAVILASCLWFVVRARSGNLDIPLLFFSLSSLYFWLDKKYIKAAVFTGLLILTKTLIPFFIVPVILFILISQRKEFKVKSLVKALIVFLIIVLPWYIYNAIYDSSFLYHHFVAIGMRKETNSFANIKQLATTLSYLRAGVGRWYRLLLLLPIFSIPVMLLSKKKVFSLFFLILWTVCVSLPFLISSKTEVWHLLPMYPPLILLSSTTLVNIISRLDKYIKRPIFATVLPFIILCIAGYQTIGIYHVVNPEKQGLSSEADISIHARKYNKPIYLKSYFWPTAVFYSHQYIHRIDLEPHAGQVVEQVANDNCQDLFILSKEDISLAIHAKLNILYENYSYILATDTPTEFGNRKCNE